MSTNHTPNYNLCQWEATDQVLRSDFNQDNAKIDAALTNKLGRATLLKTAHFPADTMILRVQTEDIDWDKWEYITIHGNISGSGSSQLYVYLSDDVITNISFYVRPFIMVLFPRHDSSRNVDLLFLAYNAFVCCPNVQYQDITNIRISGSSLSGDVEVYGI